MQSYKGHADHSPAADRLQVRRMTRSEVGIAIDLAAREGWNPGIRDDGCFYAADANGFFVGELDGQPVGCVSAVAYSDSFGFMGLYIVKPESRNMGIGTRLFEEGLAYMGSRNVGGDSVMEQEDYYKSFGFQRAYCSFRYQGVGGGIMPDGVMDLSQVAFEKLLDYDSAVFAYPRPDFLRRWIDQPEGACMAVAQGGRLAGYGVIRQCHVGYKIAPLFADDRHAADLLFDALRSRVPGQPIFLDTPEANPAAVALAEHHSMSVAFRTARIYTKGEPPIPLDRWYGVTSFELG